MTFLTPSIITLQVVGKNSTEFDTITGSTINGKLTLSDHSRSPLSVNYEIIENSQRMANGTMRKYVIAKKRNLTCQWSMLPTITSMVADGNANAYKFKSFYDINCHEQLTMSLYSHKNNAADTSYVETFNVFWTNFSYDIVKRYRDFDYWNVTTDFTEI